MAHRFNPLQRSITAALLLTVLVAGATSCDKGTENENSNTDQMAGVDTAAEVAPTPVVNVAMLGLTSSQEYGQYVVDADGRALYMFSADTQGDTSSCTGDCMQAWPPLVTTGTPGVSVPDLDSALVGTVTRPDGAMQVTYNGWPLYYYQSDTGPGQTMGEGLNGFGGDWYLVNPSGEKIEAKRSS